jgi:hypothetical protein
MRYQQIVVMFGRSPQREVLMQETNALCTVGPFTLKTLPRQLQHPLARVDAIDLHFRMHPQELAKKSTIPVAYDKRTPRRDDLAETRDPATLKCLTKRDPLQRPIPGRERVEAHACMTGSASSGVSRTRSASAVR